MTLNSISSSDIQIGINQNKSSADKVLSKIAAMHMINNDSPADLLLYNRQQSQILEASQKLQNSNESYAMLQISDKAVQSLRQGVSDLQTQSVARNNAALNSDQKAMLDSASQGALSIMQATLEQTTYNGQNLLGDISLRGLDSSDVQSLENFASMLDGRLGDIGAASNEMLSQIKQHSAMMESLSSAKQTREYDVAELVNQLKSDDTKTNASILAQQHNTDVLAKRISTLLA